MNVCSVTEMHLKMKCCGRGSINSLKIKKSGSWAQLTTCLPHGLSKWNFLSFSPPKGGGAL